MAYDNYPLPDYEDDQETKANSDKNKTQSKVHLILYASGKDKNTFKSAAVVVEKDYKKHYPKDSVKLARFTTGKSLVEIINKQSDGAIVSLDIISHGNQGGVHVSEKLENAEETYWAKKKMHIAIRGEEFKEAGKDPEKEAEFMEEKMLGLYAGKTSAMGVSYYFNQKLFKDESLWGRLKGKFSKSYLNEGIALLDDIEAVKFSESAFIEFHGCRIAEYLPGLNTVKDNFAENFAEHIGNSCTVVGHQNNNYPNGHPKNTNDYRHNKVRVYKMSWPNIDASESKAKERWGQEFVNSSTPPQ